MTQPKIVEKFKTKFLRMKATSCTCAPTKTLINFRAGLCNGKNCSACCSAMLTDAFNDCGAGFPIGKRFDSKLFNPRRLQAKSIVQTGVQEKFLYSDDMTEKGIQDP